MNNNKFGIGEREKKYRFWIKSENKMIYSKNRSLPVKCSDQRDWELYSEGEVIEMEYTGLKGKNNKEVYEGDLIMYGGSLCMVRYDDEDLSWWVVGYSGIVSDPLSHFGLLEVIGNVFQNPELLEPNK